MTPSSYGGAAPGSTTHPLINTTMTNISSSTNKYSKNIEIQPNPPNTGGK